MGSTRAELRARIIRTFRRTDKDTEINEAINDTIFEMYGIYQQRKTSQQLYVPTVINQEDYALPDHLLRINHPIRCIDPSEDNSSSNHYPMRFITKDEYDVLEPAPNVATIVDTDQPTHYTIWKNCILVHPLPDDVYNLEINCAIDPTNLPLSADIDECLFDKRWDETIAAGTLSRIFALVELFDRSQFYANIYQNGYAGGGDGTFRGGIKLLRELDKEVGRAPLIVQNRDF